MMKNFTIGFCLADSEYMTALRLAVGAVCAAADVDVDSIEDMKVCITESCILLKGCGFVNVEVSLSCDSGVTASVEGVGGTPVPADNEFSLALISALVSSCDIGKKEGAVSKIVLKL